MAYRGGPELLFDRAMAAELAARDAKEGAAVLDRYRTTLPNGAHDSDARDWQKRLLGQMPSLLDKTQDFG